MNAIIESFVTNYSKILQKMQQSYGYDPDQIPDAPTVVPELLPLGSYAFFSSPALFESLTDFVRIYSSDSAESETPKWREKMRSAAKVTAERSREFGTVPFFLLYYCLKSLIWPSREKSETDETGGLIRNSGW